MAGNQLDLNVNDIVNETVSNTVSFAAADFVLNNKWRQKRIWRVAGASALQVVVKPMTTDFLKGFNPPGEQDAAVKDFLKLSVCIWLIDMVDGGGQSFMNSVIDASKTVITRRFIMDPLLMRTGGNNGA